MTPIRRDLVVKPFFYLLALMLVTAVAGCGGAEDSQEVKLPKLADKNSVDVPRTIEALSHAEPRVRILNAYRLGELGPRAAEAIPALQKLTNDPDPRVKLRAEEALAKIQASDESTPESD